MDLAAVMDLVREAVGVAIKLASPLLILRLVVVVTVLLIGGGWMMETLQDYTYQVFALIATY